MTMNPSSLQIRRGTLADAAALAEFAQRTFLETFGAANRPEHLEAYLPSAYGIEPQSRELRDPAVVTLLGYADEHLVAYAQVRRTERPPCVEPTDAVELQRFYVDQPAHGKGVAQRMMAAVHDCARSFGARHVWLGVWERNPRGIAFYRKCGFVEVGVKLFDVGGDLQSDRVLVMPLAPA
jgi:diamine N-acetyltransferase